MDREKEPVSYALLDSLFYLGQTEIPVRSRYGENVVLYNHKNRMVLGIDKDGKSYLEANGIYTTESVSSQLVKNSAGVTPESKSTEAGEKRSIFRALLAGGGQNSTAKSKRISMGTLPMLSSSGGSTELAPAHTVRRPSLQPMNLFLAKSATALDTEKNTSSLAAPQIFGKYNKAKRVSNNEETLKAFMIDRIKEDGDDQVDDEDSASYDLAQITVSSGSHRDSTRESVHRGRMSSVASSDNNPTIVVPTDKPKPKRKNSISRSTADLLSKSINVFAGNNSTLSPEKISPVRRGSSIPENLPLKTKSDDVYNGILSTTIDNDLRDVYVRVDETMLTVTNCALTETFLELDLKKAIATPKRSSPDFEFDFISPRLRQSFIAPTYLKMIEWMAVINSVASTLLIEPTGNMYSDMYADIFEREYRILLHQIETRDSSLTLYDTKFETFLNSAGPQNTEMIERSLFRINSADDGVIKYDADLPKTPFNLAGASIDKIVERLTDVYGPDQGFITLILHTYRCFTDSPTLLKKLIARMNPIMKQNEGHMSGWKPIIKLRVISVVFKWMCLAWKPDFQTEGAKTLTADFFDSISATFGSSNDQDKQLDAKYGAKFETIKKSFQNRLGSSKQNSAISQSGSVSNLTQSFHRDSGMLRDNPSPSIVRPAITKSKVELSAVDADAIVIALTDKEQGQLLQITPLTLLLHLWQSKEPLVHELIKPINDMVESFNAMSFWVATEITTQPEMKNRTSTIEKFIKIANHCFKLNNFNTTMAIVSGLNLNSVSRLKQTWEQVDAKKKKQLEKLEEVMTPLGNYKAYRAYVGEMDSNCPHIPVVSLMLKDLLFAHDGNPTILAEKETKTLINYSKLKSIYDRVAIFSHLHKSKTFQIPKDTPGFLIAEEYCQNLRRLNEQQLYKYSLLCEPKVGDEHLNLRGKWMTQK